MSQWAALAGDDDPDDTWEEAINKRKENFQQRVQKKREQEKIKQQIVEHESGITKEKEFQEKERREQEKYKKWQQKQKQKKQEAVIHVTNADDLAALLTRVFNSQPDASMTLSAVGNRFFAYTGTSWNEKYKKKYGELSTFLYKRSEFVEYEAQWYSKEVYDAIYRKDKKQRTNSETSSTSTTGTKTASNESTSSNSSKSKNKNNKKKTATAVQPSLSFIGIMSKLFWLAVVAGVAYFVIHSVQQEAAKQGRSL